MALEMFITAEQYDALEESRKVEYSEHDNGTYMLQVKGAVPEGQVEGLIRIKDKHLGQIKKLKEEREELQARLQVLNDDMEEMKVVMETIKTQKGNEKSDGSGSNENMENEDKYKEMYEQKLERVNKQYQTQMEAKEKIIQELQKQSTEVKDKLDSYYLDQAVRDAISSIAEIKRQDLWKHVLDDAKQVFKINEGGVPAPIDDTELGSDGSPLKITEWAKKCVKHYTGIYFEGPSGGDSRTKSGVALQMNGGNVRREEIEKQRNEAAKMGKFGEVAYLERVLQQSKQ